MSDLKISCVIVDDEPMALNLVESYVKKTPFLQLKKSVAVQLKLWSLLKNNLSIYCF